MIGERPRLGRPERELLAQGLSLLLALVLAVVPLPAVTLSFRPDWVAVWVIYWVLATPEKVGLGKAWAAGLCMDVLYGTALGEQALAAAVLAFVTDRIHLRLRMFPRWQQALAVFVLVSLAHLIVLWARHALGRPGGDLAYWLSAATSGMVWLLVYPLLQTLRERLQVL
ncbi:MAG TPA: rod shape-determining protein MreD [Acidiferrobacteraceae bacterium]|nr:rod shape-determining protein MreD [Acidiferrobacteraceae bacterium]